MIVLREHTGRLLTAGYLGALLWIGFELWRPLPEAPSADPAVAVRLPHWQPPRVEIGDIGDFGALVERPPFAAGGQAATADEPPGPTRPVADTGLLRDLRLAGVSMDDDRPTALVEDANGRTKRLRVGAMLQRWRVSAIREDRIVLTGEDGRSEMVYTLDPTDLPPVPRSREPTPRVIRVPPKTVAPTPAPRVSRLPEKLRR